MLKYLVKTTRGGFEVCEDGCNRIVIFTQNDQEFDELDKAEAFYKAQCEQIDAPEVTLCSFDPDDETGRLEYILESYNP
jgi:hypothetical protein